MRAVGRKEGGGGQARNIHALPRLTRGPNVITSAIYVKRSPVQWRMIFVYVWNTAKWDGEGAGSKINVVDTELSDLFRDLQKIYAISCDL